MITIEKIRQLWLGGQMGKQPLVLRLESMPDVIPGTMRVSERPVDDPSKEPVLLWRGQAFLDPDTYLPDVAAVVCIGERLFAAHFNAEQCQDLRSVYGMIDVDVDILGEL